MRKAHPGIVAVQVGEDGASVAPLASTGLRSVYERSAPGISTFIAAKLG